MHATPSDAFPVEHVAEALATVAADGALAARNARMVELLRVLGDQRGPVRRFPDLPLTEHQNMQLQDGMSAMVDVAGSPHEFRLARCSATTWLVVSDRRAETDLAGIVLAAARARALGAFAGGLAHDLCNQLTLGLALGQQLQPLAISPMQQQTLAELAHGAKSAAQLSRALARLLQRRPRRRSVVQVQQVVDEVTAIFRTHSDRGRSEVSVVPAGRALAVYAVPEEMAQALLHSLRYCMAACPPPESIVITVDEGRRSIAGGRARDVARMLVSTGTMPGAVVSMAMGLLAASAGVLELLPRVGESGTELLLASAATACSGGSCLAREQEAGLQLEFVWPLVPSRPSRLPPEGL